MAKLLIWNPFFDFCQWGLLVKFYFEPQSRQPPSGVKNEISRSPPHWVIGDPIPSPCPTSTHLSRRHPKSLQNIDLAISRRPDGPRSSRFQLSAYFRTLSIVRWVAGLQSFNLIDFMHLGLVWRWVGGPREVQRSSKGVVQRRAHKRKEACCKKSKFWVSKQ